MLQVLFVMLVTEISVAAVAPIITGQMNELDPMLQCNFFF